jgi:hypothetical protein
LKKGITLASNDSPERAPMKLDAETERFWNDLLTAKEDKLYLFEIAVDLERLAGRFDAPTGGFRIPLSAGLRSIIQRAGDLADAWEIYDPEIDAGLQTVAWRFANHAFDLRYGDDVKWPGGGIVADQLVVDSPEVGDLSLSGRLLRPGKPPSTRRASISLLKILWRKITP